MLAPNAPLRAAVTALAGTKDEAPVAIHEGNPPALDSEPVAPNAAPEVTDEPAHRKAARYVRTLLLARFRRQAQAQPAAARLRPIHTRPPSTFTGYEVAQP